MKLITHLITSLILSSFLMKFGIITYNDTIFVVFGAVFPDIIESFLNLRHRSVYFHNFLLPIVFLSFSTYLYFLYPFSIGYLHHLFLDSQTVSGVYFMKNKIKGELKSNDVFYNILVIILHLILLL